MLSKINITASDFGALNADYGDFFVMAQSSGSAWCGELRMSCPWDYWCRVALGPHCNGLGIHDKALLRDRDSAHSYSYCLR